MPALIAAGAAATVTLLVLVAAAGIRVAARRYGESVRVVAHEGLADLFVFIEPRRLLGISAAAVVALLGVVYALGGSLAPAVAAGCLGLAGPRLAYRWLRRRRERALVHQLPDALAALAGALRAGLGLTQALGTLAEQQPRPLALEFALVLRKQRLGMPLDQALHELATRVPRHEFSLFVTSVRIARELGSNLAESLDRLADSLRRSMTMQDRIDALTAQGKLQGWIVGSLPLFLLVVLDALEPEAMRLLYTTPAGWAVLTVIAVLLASGGLLIRRIVRIDI